jgi:hypothetical protein
VLLALEHDEEPQHLRIGLVAEAVVRRSPESGCSIARSWASRSVILSSAPRFTRVVIICAHTACSVPSMATARDRTRGEGSERVDGSGCHDLAMAARVLILSTPRPVHP